jgi:POT family proton-dependent oligopeptide transporter
MGMACRFWFSWYMLLGLVVILGTKYLTHVGNLETQKVNEVDESSYGRLGDLLKSKTQLVFIIFCFILIWMV